MESSFVYLSNKNPEIVKSKNKYEDLWITFTNTKKNRCKIPFSLKVFDINIDKGFLEFDGYYYTDKKSLPEKMYMSIRDDNDNCIKYLIVLYKKKELKETSKSFYDEDEGHNICLTPTYRIKIWFKTIKIIYSRKNGESYSVSWSSWLSFPS